MSRVLVTAVLAVVLLAGGCGDDATPAEPAAERQRAEKTQPRPKTPRPSSTAPRSTPAPAASPTGKIAPPLSFFGRGQASRTHLLTAATMPSPDADADWTHKSTGEESSRPVGACQKTPLVDLGALAAVRRVLRGPDDSGLRSRQVVGRFADRKSAWRASEVLKSWREDCEKRLDYETKDVGPLRVVSVDVGKGDRYLATYGPKDEPAVAGLGIVRKGRWLSVVEIAAPDGSYAGSPTRTAVRLISATFG